MERSLTGEETEGQVDPHFSCHQIVAKPGLESKPLDSEVSVVFAAQLGQIASAERAVLLS